MTEINIKSELINWGRCFSGKIGTEYPCRSSVVLGAKRISPYGITAINVDRAEKVEKIVLKLRKQNERQYEILLMTYTRKMDFKKKLDEVGLGKSQYRAEQSNAEHFVLGALTHSFYA